MCSRRLAARCFVLVSLASFCTTFNDAMGAEYRRSDIEAAIKLLSVQEHYERKAAADRIGDMGAAAKDAVPKLIEIVQSDPWSDVRYEAASSLGDIGPDAKAAIPALISFLKDKDQGYDRVAAPQAMVEIDPQSKEAVQALIEALNDEDPAIRQYSAMALGDYGTLAQGAVPKLIEIIKKDATTGREQDLREGAEEALGKIGGTSKDVAALTELLSDELSSTQAAAASALGKIGSESAGAVPGLIKLLSDKDEKVREAAITALGEIGPGASAAIPALKKLVKSPSSSEGIIITPSGIHKGRGIHALPDNVADAIARIEKGKR